jgi:hypothetical protein
MKQILIACVLIVCPSLAWGQTEPLKAVFLPSADHDTISQNVALVSHYELMVYAPGSTTNPTIFNVGKPDPTAGDIVVLVDDLFFKLDASTTCKPEAPTADACYTAKVAAVGPGGRGESALSPPFTLVPRAPTAPGSPVIRR